MHRWWLLGGDRTHMELSGRVGLRDADEGPARGWDRVQCILNSQPLCDLATLPCDLQEAYVEMDAELSAPGTFGHMGMYEREMRPTRVWFAARDARAECAQPERE
jgi:hypothetical protein